MALRVLLADNSETIKKVMQLSLQEFSVDLKVVTVGTDVLEVTQSFQPDIIFADVLLQKKSGYDVAKELKENPSSQNIPVILMWSGFMDVDEAKYSESKADGKLEKPFDADAVRAMVKNNVQKTKSNPLSAHLSLPDIPQANSQTTTKVQTESPQTGGGPKNIRDFLDVPTSQEPPPMDPATNQEATQTGYQLPDLDSDTDDFEQVQLTELDEDSGIPEDIPPLDDSGTVFNLEVPDDDDIPVNIEEPDDIKDMDFLLKDEETLPPTEKETEKDIQPLQPEGAALSPEQVEQIVKEQCQKIIERVVWKVVPEKAEEIIKNELDRLLKEPKP